MSAVDRFNDLGYCQVDWPDGLQRIEQIKRHLETAVLDNAAGNRCLLSFEWCKELACGITNLPEINELLQYPPAVVQCTLFAKWATRNWLVPMHQDLSIPVAEKVDRQECTGWSLKDGQWYVQPPPPIMSQLLAVRLHLDDCREDNGALRVIPGSHRYGRLNAGTAADLRGKSAEVLCQMRAGQLLFMRPLLLHASSKSNSAGRRRVLHFLLGPRELPLGLSWPAYVNTQC